jgi:transcription initiation factor TFIIIB Brf1 subunit/transcription initiation factor TFIIB
MCDCGQPGLGQPGLGQPGLGQPGLGQPDLVTDTASGDVICRNCGVVVEAHIFDEHMEFYSDHAGPRAGPPDRDEWLVSPSPILLDKLPRRTRAMGNADPHTSVRELFKIVESLSRGYSAEVQDLAKLLCRDLAQARPIRSDCRPLYAVGALYLAAKMHGHGVGRSKKEVAEEFRHVGVTERGLTSAAKLFKDTLRHAHYATRLLGGLDADDLINRCVDRLDIDETQRKAVKRQAHAVARAIPPRKVEGKTPCSVCCGVVSLALQHLGIVLTKKHLAESCRVSGATLDKMNKAVASIVGDAKSPDNL